jgi:hypothetical protein
MVLQHAKSALIAATIGVVALAGCTEIETGPLAPPAGAGPSALVKKLGTTSLSSPCGIEQLRAPRDVGPGRGADVVSMTTPPVPIRGVRVVADFPRQWHGTNGGMSFGTVYVSNWYDSSWDCATNNGGTAVSSEPVTVYTDSTEAAVVPDGIDAATWAALPPLVQQLLKDLADSLLRNDDRCGPSYTPQYQSTSCSDAKREVYGKLTSAFSAASVRSMNDYGRLNEVAYNRPGALARQLSTSEYFRVAAFALGCNLNNSLYGNFFGQFTPEDAESWATKLSFGFILSQLPWNLRNQESQLSMLILSGAKASRVGNSCLSVAQTMLLQPEGANLFTDGGLSSIIPSPGGGGTQF